MGEVRREEVRCSLISYVKEEKRVDGAVLSWNFWEHFEKDNSLLLRLNLRPNLLINVV